MARPKRYFTMPEIDQPDPEPGFQHSSDEFVVPSTDEEGQSVRAQFRCPGELMDWMGSIVASKKFPFMREGDLMRYGAKLACIQLSRIEKSVPCLEHTLERQEAAVRQRMYAARVVRHCDHLGEQLEELRKLGAWGEITWILAAEHRAADKQVESEPFWGRRWKEELDTRFAHLRTQATSKLEYIDLRPSQAYHEAERED